MCEQKLVWLINVVATSVYILRSMKTQFDENFTKHPALPRIEQNLLFHSLVGVLLDATPSRGNNKACHSRTSTKYHDNFPLFGATEAPLNPSFCGFGPCRKVTV